jgi:Mg2+/Co2+ transporter CorB
MIITITIFCIVAAIMMSSFFSCAESAMTGASEAYMADLEKNEHNKRAGLTLKILSDRSRAVITTLIGNNVCNTLGTALSTNLLVNSFGPEGVAYATLIMTFVLLIYGDMLPKSYAVENANKTALTFAPIIRFCIWLFTPMVYVLQKIVAFSFKLFGIKERESGSIDIAEIRGAIDLYNGTEIKQEKEMLKGIFDLSEICVYDVMNHRKDIYSIDIDWPIEDIIQKVENSRFSRIPVYQDKPENIVGIIMMKNFLKTCLQNKDHLDKLKVKDLLMEPWFIPETTTLLQQLQEFQKRREHFALVVDEYGTLEGVVTLEDILEEIVGNIEDETDSHNGGVNKGRDGFYLVDGQTPIRDLNRKFNWDLSDENFVTIAGYLLDMTESIPQEGQRFVFDGFEFVIVKRVRNQLQKVKIRKIEDSKVKEETHAS